MPASLSNASIISSNAFTGFRYNISRKEMKQIESPDLFFVCENKCSVVRTTKGHE